MSETPWVQARSGVQTPSHLLPPKAVQPAATVKPPPFAWKFGLVMTGCAAALLAPRRIGIAASHARSPCRCQHTNRPLSPSVGSARPGSFYTMGRCAVQMGPSRHEGPISVGSCVPESRMHPEPARPRKALLVAKRSGTVYGACGMDARQGTGRCVRFAEESCRHGRS